MHVTDYLTHEELSQLERAVLLARQRRGTVEGEVGTSHRVGTSMEFAGVRAYRTGDDFRSIDWNAFRRTGRPVTRVYAAEEQMPLHLLIDVTGSMQVGAPPKLDQARKIAVALGYLALRNQNHLGAALLGSDLPPVSASMRGSGQFQRVIHLLGRGLAQAEADVGRVMIRYAPLVRRPAIVVTITDGLEPGALDRGLRALRLQKAELVVIQVLAQEDLAPPLPSRGAAQLTDSENGRCVFVPATHATLSEYDRRLNQLNTALSKVCRSHRATLIRTTNTDPVFPTVLSYLRQGATPGSYGGSPTDDAHRRVDTHYPRESR